ncbi:ASCH domain-containing protein [bacterium]|nr:ASCH domain-containing protein [bacterium]
MSTVRVLSIRQPWAALIVAGFKHIELRSWPTRHRGLLAIHAGTRRDSAELPQAVEESLLFGQLIQLQGVVIGTVNLQDCRRAVQADSSAACCEVGTDLWAWVLDNPAKLSEPIPWKGRLGLCSMPWPGSTD